MGQGLRLVLRVKVRVKVLGSRLRAKIKVKGIGVPDGRETEFLRVEGTQKSPVKRINQT